MVPPSASPATRRLRPWMRISLYVAGSLLTLVLLAALLVPIVFRKPIERKVRQAINENVNADVSFEGLNLSLLRRFPRVTVSLENLRIVGRDVFAADTLLSTQRLDVSVNPWSLLTGGPLEIALVELNQPRARLIVLRDGRANWDIALSDSAAAVADTTPGEPIRLALQHYAIADGFVVYDDRSLPFALRLEGLTHSGSGDFTQDVLTLRTDNTIRSLTLAYDSVTYLSNWRVVGEATFRLDLANSRYEFQDNNLTLNALPVQLAGFLALPDTSRMTMDLRLNAPEAGFKQWLSIVPGMYNEHFDKLTAKGLVGFEGRVQGTYSTDSLPQFNLALTVRDGQFQYEGLPDPVTDVQLEAQVVNTWHTLDSVQVRIPRLTLKMGPNPLQARLLSKGLEPVYLDAGANGSLDLATLTRVIPLDGYTLRGKLKVDGAAKGWYGPKQMPVLNVTMGLSDGYVKSDTVAAALENFAFLLDAVSQGDLASTTIRMPRLTGVLGGQPVEARLQVANLDDPRFDVALKGRLNLAELTALFPLEGATLQGGINANLAVKGVLSDIEAKRYGRVAASGSAEVRNLAYTSRDLPAPFRLEAASFTFTPAGAELSDTRGSLGRSDFAVSGGLDNYIGYFLQENGVLSGTLTLRSRLLDVNEFTAADSAPEPDDTADVALEVVRLPANVRFTFNSTVDEVRYDNLILRNLQGIIQLKDQELRLVDCRFNTLGGSFVANGSYRTTNPDRPHAEFALRVADVQIQQAYQTFNTIQALAPVAEYATGRFGTDLSVSMDLLPNMQPYLPSVTAQGLAQLINTSIQEMPLLQGLAKATSLPALASPRIGNTTLQLRVAEGRLYVAPFEVEVGGQKLLIEGSNGLDQTVDYTVAVPMAGGQIGKLAGNLLDQIPGLGQGAAENLALVVGVTGPFRSPRITPKGVRTLQGGSSGPAEQVPLAERTREQVRDTLSAARAEAEARAKAEADRIRQEADRARAEAEARARQEAKRLEEQARQKARNALRGLLGRDSN